MKRLIVATSLALSLSLVACSSSDRYKCDENDIDRDNDGRCNE